MHIVKTYPAYLGKYIKFFYTIQATETEYTGVVHRRLPDGTLDIVFNLGAAIRLSRNGIDFSEMPKVAVTGLYPDRNFLLYNGAVHLVGAVLQPGYAHLFVNDTLEQFQQCTDNAVPIFGSGINHLQEQLQKLSVEKEKHAILERFLFNYLRKNKEEYNNDRIAWSVQQIHASNGNIPLSLLPKAHFMSERNFRRKFNEFVGMSPKKYTTIIKVKSFSKLYESLRTSYTSIATELGYIDQPHFTKDFQKIVGTNPTDYFNQLNKMGEKLIHLI